MLPTNPYQFDTIEAALADLKAGRCVVVVDDEHRENEGDLICAAQFATPDMINFMAVYARGLICLALTGERLDQLDLPLMVTKTPTPTKPPSPLVLTPPLKWAFLREFPPMTAPAPFK